MKKLGYLGLYIFLLLVACSSHTPILSQRGITQIGPSDWGLGNPIWSPDGKQVVATNITNVHTWTSEIFIVDLLTNQIRSIEKTDYGNLVAQSWSPDGGQIAFASERGGDWPEGIWLADANGTTPKKFLVEGYDAAWSPDGNSIAVFSTSLKGGMETRVLSLLDLKTMNRKVIYSVTEKYTTALGLVWSPDGTKLMFSSGKQEYDVRPRFPQVDIYILEVSTGELTKVTTEGVNDEPSWSPDGSMIAYIRSTVGDLDFRLMVSYADGRCSREVIKKAYSTDWSPDGRQIAFDYAGNIYILDLATLLGGDFQQLNYLCP